jgi:3-isopropylmalate dehydrogenase
MLDTIGEKKAAAFVEAGVAKVLREDVKDVAAGKMGHSTQAVGDLVVDYIVKN